MDALISIGLPLALAFIMFSLGLGLTVRKSVSPGFYLWVEFPDSMDEMALCRAASEQSIFLAPGSVFRPGKSVNGKAAIRVNVAYGAHPRFLAFLADQLKNAPRG